MRQHFGSIPLVENSGQDASEVRMLLPYPVKAVSYTHLYAELLASPQHRAEISDLLRNLEVGQCVFQGPIYIGEEAKPTCAPICVNVSHLEDIASASLSKSST